MEYLYFLIYGLIVCILTVSVGSTLIGYYFIRRSEYEKEKYGKLSEILKNMLDKIPPK